MKNKKDMTPKCPLKNPADFVDLEKSSGSIGREDCQSQWQTAIAQYLNNASVLDVGAGLCKSRERLSVRGLRVITQDAFPGSPADITCPIAEIPSKAFDYVVSFDVIEHVEDYEAFVGELARISKKGFAISTPNYLVSKNSHRFHRREFCPDELPALMDTIGMEVQAAWCQLPGRGVFQVSREELEECSGTHGFLILFKHRL